MRLPSLWRTSPLLGGFFREDFEKAFEDFFGRARGIAPAGAGPIAFVPDIDMIDRGADFLVKAELPGIELKDIDVSIIGDSLRIKGEKKIEKEEKKENMYFAEREYGSFLRVIPLPVEIDAGKIDARLEKGILEIVLPKAQPAPTTKVEVKAGGEAAKAAKAPEAPRAREERPGAKT